MSEWLPVLSGVLRGLIFGPILLSVYINDLDVNLRNYVLKFKKYEICNQNLINCINDLKIGKCVYCSRV